MLFITSEESTNWRRLGEQALQGDLTPDLPDYNLKRGLLPHFYFYLGGLLASHNRHNEALDWYRSGALLEDGMFNALMTAFMERNGGELRMPAVVFADPRPYEHFTTVPDVVALRERFISFAAASLPVATDPVTIMDVGCGDGSMLVLLLKRLQQAGQATEIERLILVDASIAMLELASQKLGQAFPGVVVEKRHGRIQELAADLPQGITIALMSLSYHHMPWDDKALHLRELAGKVDNLLLMELDGDNDIPELNSPELAVSVYQSYGPLMDSIFAHDAPVEVSQRCVDNFLMAEVVSLLTESRGVRNDYHMLRSQWAQLFAENLTGHVCQGETTVMISDGCELFGCHWGKRTAQ